MNNRKVEAAGFSVEAHNLSRDVEIRKNTTVRILENINFQAAPGRITAIVGPSGSGKSTLLYCLSGLERATEGTVRLLGEDITKMKKGELTKFRREHLGFVFQSYNLVSSMNVEQNLALPSILRHKRFSVQRAQELLSEIGLQRQLKEDVTHLSGGEQQRVALARVILADTDIIFADEPTGALDQKTGQKIIAMLSQLARQKNKTVVMVTHDEGIAKSCDNVIQVCDGRVVEDDPEESL